MSVPGTRPLTLLVNGRVVGEVYEARGFLARLIGLMGRTDTPGHGLVFRRCSSIHTWFMRYALDVVYIGEDWRVTKVAAVHPWRVSAARGASTVMELRRGMARELALSPGVRVDFVE